MATQLSTKEESSVPKPNFSTEALERLFFWARDRVASVVAQTTRPNPTALGELGDALVLGAFVSFKKRGALRSCMGYMREGSRLAEALDHSAVSAAKEDPRFPPIAPSEFYDLDMEVWALGAMREIEEEGEARRDAIVVGRDGIQIQGRGRRGLLLPSVATEMGWDVDRFLEGVCDKAGLARGAWKARDVRLFAFEGVSYKKPFVYLASKNPELAKLIADRQALERAGNARPVFSFAPGLFQWNAPNTNARQKEAPVDRSTETRRSAVADMFYPKSRKSQESLIASFESTFAPFEGKKRVSGALVPHAGGIYSGRLASETLNRIETPKTVVVLAPKHRREGANLAVMPCGVWDFGAGQVANDLEFVERLTSAVPAFKKDVIAHRSEHSIEVQLPLIARFLPGAKVVGVLIGRASRGELRELASKFAQMLDAWEDEKREKPLLLISSDMNHYASDAATREIDKKATDAIETTDPDTLFDVVMREGISMCGVLPAYFALTALKARGEFNRAIRVGYATSGDSSGDKERVVGYAGYLFE